MHCVSTEMDGGVECGKFGFSLCSCFSRLCGLSQHWPAWTGCQKITAILFQKIIFLFANAVSCLYMASIGGQVPRILHKFKLSSLLELIRDTIGWCFFKLIKLSVLFFDPRGDICPLHLTHLNYKEQWAATQCGTRGPTPALTTKCLGQGQWQEQKPEYPEEIHTDKERTRAGMGFNLRTFLLWGSSAHHRSTMLPNTNAGTGTGCAQGSYRLCDRTYNELRLPLSRSLKEAKRKLSYTRPKPTRAAASWGGQIHSPHYRDEGLLSRKSVELYKKKFRHLLFIEVYSLSTRWTT